ncbi:MAG: hypothetical protein JXB32_09385 [Deltaproteobacteria bacterium]|nr:hypothetical protein [Deltaproteobacteria bacterium]
MTEERKPQDPPTRPKVRSPRAIRTLVLCALAAAPAAACGPSQTGGPAEPQPSADASTSPDPDPATDYGVPIEPYQPVVSEYAVVEPEPYEPITEYAVALPPEREAVDVYGAPMTEE